MSFESELYTVKLSVCPDLVAGLGETSIFIQAVEDICKEGNLVPNYIVGEDPRGLDGVIGCGLLGDSFAVAAAVMTLMEEQVIEPVNPLEIRPTLVVGLHEQLDGKRPTTYLPVVS